MMNRIVLLLLILLGLQSAEQKKITISETVKLVISYNDYGTRSEGQTGALYDNGKEIIGTKDQILEINGIKLKYYPENQQLLWLPKRWNFEDGTKILYSFSR